MIKIYSSEVFSPASRGRAKMQIISKRCVWVLQFFGVSFIVLLFVDAPRILKVSPSIQRIEYMYTALVIGWKVLSPILSRFGMCVCVCVRMLVWLGTI